MSIERNKNLRNWLIGGFLFLALMLSNIFLIYKVLAQEDHFNKYEQAISALSDSVHLSIENGKNVWSQKTPEIDLNTLLNSEYFKTLAADQQTFYKELRGVKGLLTTAQAELQKQGQILAVLSTDTLGRLVGNGDSIQFMKGQELSWSESDTNKRFQWSAKTILTTKPEFQFNYDYKFKIGTTFERQKDKSVIIKYTLDDPDLKVNKIYSYTVPREEKRTRLGRFIDKNKRQILWIGAGAIFTAGSWTGYQIAK